MWVRLVIVLLYYGASVTGNTLVLTSVVFRHGDRTPDISTLYPNDPYLNDTYDPIGIGQLTSVGKRKSYQLGKLLRKRYRQFLGDEWDFEKSESWTSSYPRTQMTLQAVHAGLYPPAKGQEIDETLLWQPVDYNYLQPKDDNLIATYRSCPMFFDVVDEWEPTNPDVQNIMNDNKDALQYLSYHSGWNVNLTRLTFYLYNSLKTQQDWGHVLPDWTNAVFPEPLHTLSKLYAETYSSKLELRKILIGNLLKKIISTSLQKSTGALRPNERKIYLYSAHDFNITPLLATFKYFNGQDTPYNCFFLFELHKIDDIYAMKVFYHDYTTEKPVEIPIQNCEGLCSIDKFYQLYEDHFPGENWCSV